MKRIAAVTAQAVCFACVAFAAKAQTTSDLQMLPPFVPGEYIVALGKDFSAPNTGRQLQDFYAAAGVTEVEVFPTVAPGDHIALVRLLPGSVFGRSFRAMQTFDFGDGTRWSLNYVEPNYIRCRIPEGCPGVLEVSRVFNHSTRAEVGLGEKVVIGGLIVPGEFARLAVVKVRGPSLESFGLGGVLADPKVRLHRENEVVLENDNWGDLREFEVALANRACPLPDDPREAMLVTYLDPGAYTAVVSGADGGAGVALLEMYLLDEFRVETLAE